MDLGCDRIDLSKSAGELRGLVHVYRSRFHGDNPLHLSAARRRFVSLLPGNVDGVATYAARAVWNVFNLIGSIPRSLLR